MRTIIIICLVALVLTIAVSNIQKRRVLSIGYTFCKLSKDFQNVVLKIEKIQKDLTINQEAQAIYGEYIRLSYDPQKEVIIYYDLECLIDFIEKKYKKIENKDYCFRPDDWKEVQMCKSIFSDAVNRVRYEEWMRGYR